VVVFNADVIEVSYATAPTRETSARTVTLSGLAVAATGQVQLAATVDNRNIRIASWYWIGEDGTQIGAINRGCMSKSGCAETVAPAGFRIVSPPTQLLAREQVRYCYYFQTPNTAALTVARWRSQVGAGAVRVNLLLSPLPEHPNGTYTPAECGAVLGLSASNISKWAYTGAAGADELVFPGDDGAGLPVGLVIPPGSYGYLFIHFFNDTSTPVTSQVEVEAVPYPAGTAFTPAHVLISSDTRINVPAFGTASVVTNCPVPSGARFFSLSTYSNGYTVSAAIRDGTATVFQTTTPLNPGAAEWHAPPFFTFQSGVLTHQFDYYNPDPSPLTAGNSVASDEVAAALGYYFPATQPKICLNGLGPF
jgi:hypothetical protein